MKGKTKLNEWRSITNAHASTGVLNNYPVILCGMYIKAEQVRLILILDQVGKTKRSDFGTWLFGHGRQELQSQKLQSWLVFK